MADPARKTDPALPAEIADAMEAAGFPPEVPTLMEIIEDFARAKAEARTKAERVAELERSAEESWPLKAVVPLSVRYEDARRAAEAGRLGAIKIGGRWFCTKAEMARWVAAHGRGRPR